MLVFEVLAKTKQKKPTRKPNRNAHTWHTLLGPSLHSHFSCPTQPTPHHWSSTYTVPLLLHLAACLTSLNCTEHFLISQLQMSEPPQDGPGVVPTYSSFPADYVRWLSAAGARVAVLRYHQPLLSLLV